MYQVCDKAPAGNPKPPVAIDPDFLQEILKQRDGLQKTLEAMLTLLEKQKPKRK